MRAINSVTEKTYYIAKSADGSICHIGEIEPGLSFASGMPVCMLETDYQIHYANMELTAIPFAVGLNLTALGPPVSHNGKLYKIEQDHTVNDPNHTPDIVPALYTEIPEPGASGYPEWIQPINAETAYNIPDMVTWVGKTWISTIDANTTVPGENLAHGYWEEEVVE